jgi:hypothetical protein
MSMYVNVNVDVDFQNNCNPTLPFIIFSSYGTFPFVSAPIAKSQAIHMHRVFLSECNSCFMGI